MFLLSFNLSLVFIIKKREKKREKGKRKKKGKKNQLVMPHIGCSDHIK